MDEDEKETQLADELAKYVHAWVKRAAKCFKRNVDHWEWDAAELTISLKMPEFYEGATRLVAGIKETAFPANIKGFVPVLKEEQDVP